MQIKARLTAQFTLIVSTILLLSFIVIHITTINYRYNEFYALLNNKTKTISTLFVRLRQIDSRLFPLIDISIKDRIYNENIFIFDEKDKLVFKSNSKIYINISEPDLIKTRQLKYFEMAENGYDIVGKTFKHGKDEYIIIAGGIDKYGHNKVRNRGLTLVYIFFIIVGFVAVAGWFFSAKALLPITRVIQKVEEISPYNLSSRIDKSPNQDEIGRLINTFNNLLDRIEEAFKLQKLFVASASHQLKNPLTTITSQLEVSLINNRTNQAYKDTITSVLEDIKDINNLTFQLMELARISYSMDIPFETIRIDEILWNTKEYMVHKYPSYNYQYNIISLPENESQLCIYGNETLLKSAFINIAENACKFSPDRTVVVTLEYKLKELIIRFLDKGPGIKNDEKDLIFEPFYRSQLNPGVKGYGLGLALVKQIMNLHNANINIITEKGKGTEFILVFNTNSKMNITRI
jgi:signal transduction histidine kinase